VERDACSVNAHRRGSVGPTTSIAFSVTANHRSSRLGSILAFLGRGDFAVEKGAIHSDGTVARESVWVSEPLAVGTDKGETVSKWLNEHAHSLQTLLADNWELTLEIRVVAADPITSLSLDPGLLDAVRMLDGLSVQIIIYPKPKLQNFDY
jgi:hypothetical protein